ncbi:MAG: DnaD domain protein [Clostridia bacterium]|nr:DnaD domain protein [Clostridia bacterium]
MAFCSFDEGVALFDSTPVENMFITEYMLRAPGEFVKVYIYGLMQCYHPSCRMSLSAMAKDLDVTEEEVERAMRYWERDGLVRRVGDNPVAYTFANLKQLTLTRAHTPSEQLYDRGFAEEIERTLDQQQLTSADLNTIYDWVDVLELPQEVVIMLLQTEKARSRSGRVSLSIADRVAQEWARSGIRTVEEVEKIVIIGRERERELRRLLARLGMRREPSEDEKAMYNKWIEEWGFTADAVQEACRETTKGAPTMAYLDGILLRQHQLGRHEAQALAGGMATERTARDFAREVLAGLGRTGVTPTQDDLMLIESWRAEGSSEEMILLAVAAAHRRAGGGTMDDVGAWLQKWKAKGFHTPDAVKNDSARQRALNAQLREIYETAGVEKRPNQPDRDLLSRFMADTGLGMDMEVVLLAAQYARGSGAPMMMMNRILESWHSAGIHTAEAARAEHESHQRAAQGGRTTAAAARPADAMQRYTPQERRETYRAAVIDFDEEEN